jgi:hypothetical protein
LLPDGAEGAESQYAPGLAESGPAAIAQVQAMMKAERQLLPEEGRISNVRADMPLAPSTHVVFTRDHEVIRKWADRRQAVPATGEATASGPATVDVHDGGAGVRFNFPGTGSYRPITWEEWFENFDDHDCAFVYDNDSTVPLSSRYRIVKAAEWKDLLT